MKSILNQSAHTDRGFSLIELVIVVAILGVVSAIAVPRMSRGAEGAGVNAFANTLNQMTKAIERYHAENGEFPTQAAAMAMPSEITDQFYGDRGSKFSAFGGGTWKYMYTPGVSPVVCATFTRAPDADRMKEIDAFIDDGDLTTGLFTKVGALRYDFKIQ